MIGEGGFDGCTSLKEIVFSSESHLKEISGFTGCTSLARIEFPSSVEVIGEYGFEGCLVLREITFASNSHVKQIAGFHQCASLFQIEPPLSVEDVSGFRGCNSLRVVILQAGCRVRRNEGFRLGHPFLLHEDKTVKSCRRLFHLGTH
jgi:hypothetical protein